MRLQAGSIASRREPQRNCSSRLDLAGDADPAALRLDQPFGDREAQPAAALLTALEAASYDRSFDAIAADAMAGFVMRLPDTPCDTLEAWAAIRCNPATCSIRLPAGVRLDLGGSAKGWAADQGVRRLAAYGPALIDAGGDIEVSGPQRDGSSWPIGVADPHMPYGQIDLLLLAQGGVATSGRDYRRWQQIGSWQHHLIDPRTLRPAITDLLSVCAAAGSVDGIGAPS